MEHQLRPGSGNSCAGKHHSAIGDGRPELGVLTSVYPQQVLGITITHPCLPSLAVQITVSQAGILPNS